MTLTDFLLARIAETESDFSRSARERRFESRGAVGYVSETLARRTLTECEAKRQIVKELREAMEYDESIHEAMSMTAWAGMRVLNHLALPYADHPDYQEAWRPSLWSFNE